MELFSKLFNRSQSDAQDARTGGMEDFMTLIRVYYQAVLAGRLGITNLSALPDLRVFKQTLRVPTVNNRLGLGERNRCKKMLSEIYGLSDGFFLEIDNSIKKNCKNVNDMQSYLYMFQGFSQDLLMLLSNMLQFKLRIPAFFKGTLRAVVEKGIADIWNKDNWKDEGQRRTAVTLRQMGQRLGYSQQWMSEYAFNLVMLAKKEPRPKGEETDPKAK